jgi:hypothetical protein
MKNFATFASDIRLNTLLCCSAAVLLTACGGSTIDAGQGAQTAATVASVNASAANGDASVPNQTDAAAAQANAAGTNASFDLVGYAADPTADSAVADADQAAPADGSPRLLASFTHVKTRGNPTPATPVRRLDGHPGHHL